MDIELQAQMLTERCQIYLRHLRGVVYLLNYQAQSVSPEKLPPEWFGLIRQISHLAESTEREILHYGKNFASIIDVEPPKKQARAN